MRIHKKTNVLMSKTKEGHMTKYFKCSCGGNLQVSKITTDKNNIVTRYRTCQSCGENFKFKELPAYQIDYLIKKFRQLSTITNILQDVSNDEFDA